MHQTQVKGHQFLTLNWKQLGFTINPAISTDFQSQSFMPLIPLQQLIFHLPRSISASSRRPLVHGFNVSYGSGDKSPRTKGISKEKQTQPHSACKAIGNTFSNSHRLSSEGEREQVSVTSNFQTFSTLKVKRTRDPNAAQLQSQAHKSLGCVI